MKIEHIALNVKEPQAMAQWYVQHMGLKIVRADDTPPYITFMVDEEGGCMIELYANAEAAYLEYGRLHCATIHIAFTVTDMQQQHDQLIIAGATADGEIRTTPKGDQLAFVRDPWGQTIQLVKRVG
jgi:catechol 2,3-dioxygenase-like lactoylglutathione lyase family enzyme